MFLRLLPLLPPEIVSTVTNDRQEDLLTTAKEKAEKHPKPTLIRDRQGLQSRFLEEALKTTG